MNIHIIISTKNKKTKKHIPCNCSNCNRKLVDLCTKNSYMKMKDFGSKSISINLECWKHNPIDFFNNFMDLHYENEDNSIDNYDFDSVNE